MKSLLTTLALLFFSFAAGASLQVGMSASSLVQNEDGSLIFVGFDSSNKIQVILPSENSIKQTIILPAGTPSKHLAFADKIHKLYVATGPKKSVLVIEPANGEIIQTIAIPEAKSISSLGFNRDQSKLYAGDDSGKKIYVISTSSGSVKNESISVAQTPRKFVASPSQDKLYVLCSNFDSKGFVSVMDTQTDTLQGQAIPVGKYASSLLLSKDGQKLFVGNRETSTVNVIGTESDTRQKDIKVGSYTSSLALSPSGHQLYICGGWTVNVYDTKTFEKIKTIPLKVWNNHFALLASNDSKQLFITNFNNEKLTILKLK